jgi:hypothetical protein
MVDMIRFTFQIWRRVLRMVVGIIYDLRTHARDHLAMAQRLHVEIIRSSVSGIPTDMRRLAIVAIHPGEACLPFVLNLLEALKASGFSRFILSTKRLNASLAEPLIEHSDKLIERHGIGRDFGSYQMGIGLLKEWGVYDSVDMLVLANDSMFYQSGFSETLSEMLDSDWSALFENYEIHYHAQSFFQVFGRPVLQSEAFNKFWSDYVPFSSRKHAIDNGEVGLSSKLIEAGYFPSVVYTSRRLVDALSKRYEKGNDIDLISKALYATMGPRYTEMLRNLPADQSSAMLERNASSVLECTIASEIAKRSETTNPTHTVGLLANVLLNAPIKRDIAYRGCATAGEVLRVASGYSPQEIACMERDFRIRGNAAMLRGLRRMLYNAGCI